MIAFTMNVLKCGARFCVGLAGVLSEVKGDI